MQNQVIIKPLPPKGRHQFGVFPNTNRTYSGRTLGKNGQFITGLTEEKARELGDRLGVDLKPSSSFWDRFKIVLNDKGKVLDLSDPNQELEYHVLLTKTDIAASQDKIKSHSIYVMYNEEAEAEKVNKELDYELTAYTYISQMSAEERADFLKLFGHRTRNMSPNLVKKTLKDKADDDAKRFVELYEDKAKALRILVEDCIQYRVITVKNGAYYFGDDMLGADVDLALNKLKQPKNSDLILSIKKRLVEASSVK